MLNSKNIVFNIYRKFREKANRGRGIGFGKSSIGKKLIKSTDEMLKPDYCFVQGHKMFLDKFDSLDLSINKEYGVLETKIIKDEIKPGDIVLDIGAHIGYFTLILAKYVGDKGLVCAFEPEPKNFKLLSKNVQVNNYKNVILTNKAVSNKNEKCLLYVGQESSGANRIYEPKKSLSQKFQTVTTETIVLDDFFKNKENLDKISFIKMDMEGAEYKAILGMDLLFEKNKKISILTEFSKKSIEDSGHTSLEFIDFFYNNGFQVNLLDEKNKKIVPITKTELLKIDSNTQLINLLCKR
tara:strand:+ start:669 stop:1556 length:888 start_codon:yes stop_codon:yes gene_type:complete